MSDLRGRIADEISSIQVGSGYESTTKERRPMTDILSPDCRDGKCAACTGDAWNNQTDEPTPCECACHETKEE